MIQMGYQYGAYDAKEQPIERFETSNCEQHVDDAK